MGRFLRGQSIHEKQKGHRIDSIQWPFFTRGGADGGRRPGTKLVRGLRLTNRSLRKIPKNVKKKGEGDMDSVGTCALEDARCFIK